MGSGASGRLAELPLSGAGNKSVTRSREGKGGLRPSRKWGGGERPGGTVSIILGEGSLVSPPTPLDLDRCSGLCLHIGLELGVATRLSSQISQSSRGPCMIRRSLENFSEEAILEQGGDRWRMEGVLLRQRVWNKGLRQE